MKHTPTFISENTSGRRDLESRIEFSLILIMNEHPQNPLSENDIAS